MPIELARISAARLRALSPSTTVFFFPVGTLEDHGPHLPLGLDLAEAERLCWMAGERLEKEMTGWTALIAPPAPIGVETDTTELALTVRGYVLRDWLIDWCRALMKQGFRHFVCYSGALTPKQLTAIEEAGKSIASRSWLGRMIRTSSARAYLASASSVLTTPKDMRSSPFFPNPAEHGAKRDTSVALALGLAVDPTYSALIPVERPASGILEMGMKRLRRKVQGYWGKPADANAATGQSALKEAIDDTFPKLRATWEGANPNLIFRSWYSVLPPNKTFFKAWTLFTAFLVILILWMYWAVKVLLG